MTAMGDYRKIATIAGKGSAPEQFRESLRGVCVDAAGRIWAVGDRRLKCFEPSGKLLNEWRTVRPGYCIAMGQAKEGETSSDPFWVGQAGQCERFDAAGKSLPAWVDSPRLGTVTAIGFAGDDVLLGDATARCIRRYDRAGKWLNDIGDKSNTRGLVIPNGQVDFAVDRAGVVHACNPGKHRVERYNAAGELLGQFGKFGMQRPEDFTGCCNPTNIALLPDGRMVVAEKAPPRVKVYDTKGESVAVIADEVFDPQCRNMDLAVDSKGRIYVADAERLVIHVFAQPEQAATAPASSPSKAGGS